MFLNCRLRFGFLSASLMLILYLVFSPIPAEAGYLYLLNDDSTGNRIYGFQVNETTGELTALSGFPVNALVGGINNIVSERMTVDPVNKRLYVLNEGSDSMSVYSIDSATGSITAMPFSPIALGTGTWNTVAVHPSGSPVIVSNGASGSGAFSFNITSTTATPAVGNPFLVGATSAFSSRFSRDGAYFYVGGNTGSVIAGFSVNVADGVLTALPGSPFPAGATSTIAYATDAGGRLFGVDTNDAIRIFTSTNGVLAPVTGNPFISGLTQRRFGLIHPNGNFYMVAGNTGNNVGVFQISGTGAATTVAPVTGSPFATGGTTANVMALNQAGTFLYVGNRISRNVSRFAVNMTTGGLSSLTVQTSNTLGTVGAINGIGYLPDLVASNAMISGRITKADGTGAGKVVVSLSSMDGTVNLIALTNPFGYYSFPSVLTGTTYTLTPSAKIFTFKPESIALNHTGDIADQNFTAMQE